MIIECIHHNYISKINNRYIERYFTSKKKMLQKSV